MDINKIFELFDDGWKNNDKNIELENYKETPIFKVKMFIKLIKNGGAFKNSVIDVFSKSNIGLDPEMIGDAGDHLMYSRAFYWIDLVDPNSDDYMGFVDVGEFSRFLNLCLKHFEDIEEYEKCAHLNKFLIKLKESLPK